MCRPPRLAAVRDGTPPGAAARANTDFSALINPASLEVLKECKVEPTLASAASGAHYQFERQGYFTVDPDSQTGAPVFNRTVSLKDSWSRSSQPSRVDG